MTPTNEELYEKAKQLVGEERIDEEIDKLKRSGNCISTHQALNALIRENSREVVGKEVMKGFILGSFQNDKVTVIHVLSDGQVHSMFVDKKTEKGLKVPKPFSPVKVVANKIRNMLTDTESLSLTKMKPTNGLQRSDMIPWLQSPRNIGPKVNERDARYLIAGKVRGVFVQGPYLPGGARPEKMPPIYEKTPDGERRLNLKVQVCDLEDDNAKCGVKIKTVEHLAAVLGASEDKPIAVGKVIPILKGENDEVLGRLRDAMLGQEVVMFGSGSNQSPGRDDRRELKTPYLSVGQDGFIRSYRHFVSGNGTKEPEPDEEGEEEEGEEEEEEEPEVEKKAPKKSSSGEKSPEKHEKVKGGKRGQSTLDHLVKGSAKGPKMAKAEEIVSSLIKKNKSDKATLKSATQKAGVYEQAQKLVSGWMEKGKVKVVKGSLVMT